MHLILWGPQHNQSLVACTHAVTSQQLYEACGGCSYDINKRNVMNAISCFDEYSQLETLYEVVDVKLTQLQTCQFTGYKVQLYYTHSYNYVATCLADHIHSYILILKSDHFPSMWLATQVTTASQLHPTYYIMCMHDVATDMIATAYSQLAG